jgi:hypothetical protein
MKRDLEQQRAAESWVGRTVKARIKTRRGGEYLAIGKLVDVNEERIRLLTGSGGEPWSLEDASSYPWSSVAGVQLFGDNKPT